MLVESATIRCPRPVRGPNHVVVDFLVIPQARLVRNITVGILWRVNALRTVLVNDRVRVTDMVRVRVRTNIKVQIGTIHTELLQIRVHVARVPPRGDTVTPRVTRVRPVRVIVVLSTIHDTEMAVRLQHDSVSVRQRHNVNLVVTDRPVSLPERHIRSTVLPNRRVTARCFGVCRTHSERCRERERERRNSGNARTTHRFLQHVNYCHTLTNTFLQPAPPTKQVNSERGGANKHSPSSLSEQSIK